MFSRQEPTCVIVKHTNPCGVASKGDLLEAYRLAVRADPVSAFGGIVAFNTVVDEKLAKEIREFRWGGGARGLGPAPGGGD
jgi:phosphoribosylaminoimidazolecarboxamide formyltransferase/IMP cyclohydrolase